LLEVLPEFAPVFPELDPMLPEPELLPMLPELELPELPPVLFAELFL
jgi:hypothetical protein